MTRESRAKYKRCTPMEIETAIHALTRGAFAETEDKLVLKPVILDIGTAVGDDDNGQPKTAEILSEGSEGGWNFHYYGTSASTISWQSRTIS